ncbi:4-hydroxy-3-methylbut-2-enyl diphosphate reductase, partial [candidate division TA06 bacterium]
DRAWFRNSHKLGITAGASTPDWIIEDVIDLIGAGAEHTVLRGRAFH